MVRYGKRAFKIHADDNEIISAECPEGMSAVSAGISFDGSQKNVGIVRLRDNLPDSQAQPRLIGSGSASGTVKTTCIPNTTTILIAPSSSVPVNGPAQVTVDVPCLAGWTVLGGGATLTDTGDAVIMTSRPVDGADGDAAPNDAWRIVANNPTSGNSSSLMAQVVCIEGDAGQVLVQKESLTEPRSNDTVGVDCPHGKKAVGGGADIGSINIATRLGSTAPKRHGSGWTSKYYNPDPARVPISTYAICL